MLTYILIYEKKIFKIFILYKDVKICINKNLNEKKHNRKTNTLKTH